LQFETDGPTEITGSTSIDVIKFEVIIRLTLRFHSATGAADPVAFLKAGRMPALRILSLYSAILNKSVRNEKRPSTPESSRQQCSAAIDGQAGSQTEFARTAIIQLEITSGTGIFASNSL